MSGKRIWLAAWGAFAILLCSAVGAQGETPPEKTLIEVEILMPAMPGDPLGPQRWRGFFEKVGQSVQIRQALAGDKPQVTEVQRGPFRIVKAVGQLDRRGQLEFPGKSFSLSSEAALKDWLDELQVYGALGSPAGKPRWGLTEDQFKVVFAGLSDPVTESLQGRTFAEALSLLPVPKSTPVVFQTDATSIQAAHQEERFRDELEGLTTGTALAFLLSQMDLGFQPLRKPNGEVHLAVSPLSAISKPWPVGWPVDEKQNRADVYPRLFEMAKTGFEQDAVSSILDSIEQETKTRVLVDRVASLKKNIDPDEALGSYPARRVAPLMVIRTVAGGARLHVNFRVDEAARGFLLIAPFVPYVPEESSARGR